MPPQRTLGGGRVLGSGKSLAPPPPPTTTTVAPAVLSPSASSLSLSSHTTSSTPLSVNDDLTARVDRHHHHHPGNPDTVAGAGISRMVCPICDEEMVRSCLSCRSLCLSVWLPACLSGFDEERGANRAVYVGHIVTTKPVSHLFFHSFLSPHSSH